ncbi:MAG: PepSY domain-containing protein [Pseudomonadota bacterium]
MKPTLFFAVVTVAALVMTASHADEIDAETVEKIQAYLASINCQMDPDDIELEDDGGYDLDDVICEGGNQFDITLDKDLNETGRRAE